MKLRIYGESMVFVGKGCIYPYDPECIWVNLSGWITNGGKEL